MSKEHFLSITDLSAKKIWQVFELARKLKKDMVEERTSFEKLPFAGKSMAMLFEKPSLRTRASFDVGFYQLGGHPVYLGPEEVGLGKRESVADVTRVTARYHDLIVARVNKHKTLEEMAQVSTIPVINALSDLEHPCQALADLFTIWEVRKYKKLSGLTIGYVGDGDNNVAHSLCLGSAMMNIAFRCGSPDGFGLNKEIVEKAKEYGGTIVETDDPKKAVANADVVVTDTWVSMGDVEGDRTQILEPYQVNEALMQNAKKEAIFLHCLPAHRGEEVTAGVIDGPQSVVFQEAENRLHVQKALMLHILGLYKS